MLLSLFLRSFSAIWVLLRHLTWQCDSKRQGRTEPSELLQNQLQISREKSNTLTFCTAESTMWCLKITFLQPFSVNFAPGSHNSIEKINYSSKIGIIYPCLAKAGNILTVLSLGGDWALASNNNSPGEGYISSLRQISTHTPPMQGQLLCFHSANKRNAEVFKLGGGCVEICLNEEM